MKKGDFEMYFYEAYLEELERNKKRSKKMEGFIKRTKQDVAKKTSVSFGKKKNGNE